MSATLLFNLVLLVVVGGLLIWFPDRLTLVPLILSKVQPPIASNARASRPRSRPGPDKYQRQTKKAARTKKRPRKAKAR